MRKLMNAILAGGLALSMIAGSSAAQSAGGSASVTVNCVNPTTACVYSVGITSVTFTAVPYSMTTIQNRTGEISVTAKDDTGTGAGWKVTIHGTDFSTDTLNPFPVSNLALTPKDAGLTSDLGQGVSPTNMSATGTSAMPNIPGEAVKIIGADAKHGRGHYTSVYNASLNVPAGTLTGTYSSTLTVTITSGTTP